MIYGLGNVTDFIEMLIDDICSVTVKRKGELVWSKLKDNRFFYMVNIKGELNVRFRQTL